MIAVGTKQWAGVALMRSAIGFYQNSRSYAAACMVALVDPQLSILTWTIFMNFYYSSRVKTLPIGHLTKKNKEKKVSFIQQLIFGFTMPDLEQ